MKVNCDRAALLEAVNLVASVVPSRTPSPQLSCIKLTATKAGPAGQLSLLGTDNETSMLVHLRQVDVSEPGEAVIPADKLRQIVSAEEGEPTLELETEGDQCHIRGANAHYKVLGHPASDYPALPDLQAVSAGKAPESAKAVFSHDARGTIELISRTVFATARETSRYAINGVLLKKKGKSLEIVATDGRRLAVSRGKLAEAGSKDDSVQCIIPTKPLNILMKLIRDDDDTIRIAITDSRVFFAVHHPEGEDETPAAVLSSVLVEGAFPPYEDVIPKDQDKKVVAPREDLSLAVRKAKVLTNEESRGVRMAFTTADKRLRLSSRAPEMGEAEIDVGLSDFTGDDIEISFNPDFIIDVLKVLTGPQVIVELKGPNKPGVIRSDSGDFTYVVMPVNLPV